MGDSLRCLPFLLVSVVVIEIPPAEAVSDAESAQHQQHSRLVGPKRHIPGADPDHRQCKAYKHWQTVVQKSLHPQPLRVALYRQRRALLALDDAFLKDIGLSRVDALVEGGKPFWRP